MNKIEKIIRGVGKNGEKKGRDNCNFGKNCKRG